MSFPERLKQLRIESNFMQKQIAEILGVSVRMVQRYERGDIEPNIEKLILLANLFNVSVDYLICRKESL